MGSGDHLHFIHFPAVAITAPIAHAHSAIRPQLSGQYLFGNQCIKNLSVLRPNSSLHVDCQCLRKFSLPGEICRPVCIFLRFPVITDIRICRKIDLAEDLIFSAQRFQHVLFLSLRFLSFWIHTSSFLHRQVFPAKDPAIHAAAAQLASDNFVSWKQKEYRELTTILSLLYVQLAAISQAL